LPTQFQPSTVEALRAVVYPPVQGPLPAPKSAVAAGLLQLFLGTFGAGRFYIGMTGRPPRN
jgi:hypothetical protein